MKKYFGGKDFTELKTIMTQVKKETEQDEKKNFELLKNLKDTQLPKKLIYIPFFALLYLPQLQSKHKIHIKNSLGISLLIALSWCVFGIDNMLQIFAVFPISYGIGYINRIGYKMPFIYDIYEIIFEKII